MRHRILTITRQHPLLTFFGLTYAISWVCWLPMIATGETRLLLIPGIFGPTLAALILTALHAGRPGLRNLLERLRIWRVGIGWYLFSLLSTALIIRLAIAIHVALGGTEPAYNDPVQWYLALVVLGYVLLFSVAGEEIGWRGYALPHLLAQNNALGASLLLGGVWGAWHLPLFFVPGNLHQTIPLGLFLIQDVALAILMTWLYRHTRGSLLLAHLFHAASNTTLGILPVLPADTGGDLRPLWITIGLLVIVTIGVIAVEGPSLKRGASDNDSTNPALTRPASYD